MPGLRKAHPAHTLIPHLQQRADPRIERLARLRRAVRILPGVRDEVAVRVVQDRVGRDVIPDGFGGDVFSRLLGGDVQARADVAEADAGVGEREHADASFDDVLAQAEDEGVGAVFAEDAPVIAHTTQEGLQVADTHRLHELEVGV